MDLPIPGYGQMLLDCSSRCMSSTGYPAMKRVPTALAVAGSYVVPTPKPKPGAGGTWPVCPAPAPPGSYLCAGLQPVPGRSPRAGCGASSPRALKGLKGLRAAAEGGLPWNPGNKETCPFLPPPHQPNAAPTTTPVPSLPPLGPAQSRPLPPGRVWPSSRRWAGRRMWRGWWTLRARSWWCRPGHRCEL